MCVQLYCGLQLGRCVCHSLLDEAMCTYPQVTTPGDSSCSQATGRWLQLFQLARAAAYSCWADVQPRVTKRTQFQMRLHVQQVIGTMWPKLMMWSGFKYVVV